MQLEHKRNGDVILWHADGITMLATMFQPASDTKFIVLDCNAPTDKPDTYRVQFMQNALDILHDINDREHGIPPR